MNNYQIPILYQDSDFIAINKPHGISIHNDEDAINLIKLIKSHYLLKNIFPVHRLDKETSGVQLLALSAESAKKLSLEFQQKNLSKKYVGVLRGKLSPTQGTWSFPITDKGEGRKNPSGKSAERQEAITHYQVAQSNEKFSLCYFDLITGRQHQIRKHSAISRHQLIGDIRYGDPRFNKKIEEEWQTSRMMLHCYSIEILGTKIETELPDEFLKFFVGSTTHSLD